MFKQNLKKPKILSTDTNTPSKPKINTKSHNHLQVLQAPTHTHLHKKAKQKHSNPKQFIKYSSNPFQQKQKMDSQISQIQNDFNSLNKNKNIKDKFYFQQPEYDSTAPQFSKVYINKKCNDLIQNYKKSKSREREQYDEQFKNNIYENQLNCKLAITNCKSQNLFFTKKSRTKLQNEDSIKSKLKQMEFKYLQLQQKYKNVLIEAKKHVSLFQMQKFRLEELKESHFQDQNELQQLRQQLFSKKHKYKSQIKTIQQAVQVHQSQIFNQNLVKKSRINFKKQNSILINQQEKCQRSVQHIHAYNSQQQEQKKLLKADHAQKQKYKTQMSWFQMQKKSLIQKSKAKNQKQAKQAKSAQKYSQGESKLNLSRSRRATEDKKLSISQLHSKSVKDFKKSRNKQQNQLSVVKRDIFNVKEHIQNLQRFKKNSASATNNLIKMREKRKNRQFQIQKQKLNCKNKTQANNHMMQNQIQDQEEENVPFNTFKYTKKSKLEIQLQNQQQQKKEKILETPIAKLLVKKSVNQNLMASKYKFKPSVDL